VKVLRWLGPVVGFVVAGVVAAFVVVTFASDEEIGDGLPALAGQSVVPAASRAPAPTASPSPNTYPLDAFRLSVSDQAMVNRAVYAVVAGCMKRQGLTPPEAPEPIDSKAKAYGIESSARAADWGYQVPADQTSTVVRPAGWDVALRGADSPQSPAGTTGTGCIGEGTAAVQIPAPSGTDPDLVEQLTDRARDDSTFDPAWQAADLMWSVCMQGRGLSFKTPELAAAGPWPAPAGAAEKATAKADVACKESTHLVRAKREVETAHQHVLVERNRAGLDAAARFNKARLAKATKVLADATAAAKG
jgi:hypothetical protein